MKLWKKLQNPYALVAQGFVVGGFLFFATRADMLDARPSAPLPQKSSLMAR